MKYIIFQLSFLILISCNGNKVDTSGNLGSLNSDSLKQVLMNVDKSWSDSSLRKGYNKSRLDFAADDAVNLLDKEMPLFGKNEISKYAATHEDSTFSLQWKALKAEVSASGDLGCTFGGWTLKTTSKNGKENTVFGDYITVWKKQADNSWKYIMDGGNETPEEVK